MEKNWYTIVVHLQQLSQGSTVDAAKAKGMLKSIISYSFVSNMFFMLDFLSILTKVSKIFQLDNITILSATNALASANLAFNALLQRPGHYRNLFDNEITANGTFRNEVLDGLQFKESVSKQQKKLVKLDLKL